MAEDGGPPPETAAAAERSIELSCARQPFTARSLRQQQLPLRARPLAACRVKGLRCEDCVQAVEAALRAVPGVSGTDAAHALSEGLITVTAAPATGIRSLMEAVRKTVWLPGPFSFRVLASA